MILIVSVANLITFMIVQGEFVIVTQPHLIILEMVVNLISHVNLVNGIMVLMFVTYAIQTAYSAVILSEVVHNVMKILF